MTRRSFFTFWVWRRPAHPLPEHSYIRWTATYQWENIYDTEFLYAGPLFIHHFSQAWIDFSGIRDRFMREKESDYFENSRRATYVQREYARRNPFSFKGYGKDCWGITASDGPGFKTLRSMAGNAAFSAMPRAACPMGPTTARSTHVRRSRRCRSRPNWPCRRCAIFVRAIPR